ncbi:interferon-induced protein 35 [Labrus mixtus]|uniref:interferon-induced protein 35 n=1 Tax=Labrus mixtus TaxID=508554 RepID=UPI0029C01F14|nr:interferon-induced protein 35 [Labrus mixtus]
MSSEEDFSLVVDDTQPSEDSLEGIKAMIAKFKKQHEELLNEQKHIADCKDVVRGCAQQFRVRTKKLTESLKRDKDDYEVQVANEKAKLASLMEEEVELKEQAEKLAAALKEEKAEYVLLKEQTEVFTAVPERRVVFKGVTGEVDGSQFEMESSIVYPMDGGTALITFDEEVVAKKILSLRTHQVNLGEECRITVEARPVRLMMPSLVEIESKACPRRILISNLPKMDTEFLLNKLEIHFSKTKNGGGEVEDREFLPDSGTVVLTFLSGDFARGLVDREYHEVMLHPDKSHRVRVTPFLNGNITNLQTKMLTCPRTLLLTGIPDFMEADTLQDLLEIHFQKSSNGGGEVTAFFYNALGQKTSALFKSVAEKEEE